MRKIRSGYHFFVAKQQSISLSIKYLDMILQFQQIMLDSGYICDV